MNELFFEQELDNEYLAQLLGLSYNEMYDICEERNCTPYELYTAMKNDLGGFNE